jgi:hypothetical protein
MTEPSVRGANGGNARAAKLTKEQRSAIAVMAAKKRWGKPKEEKIFSDSQDAERTQAFSKQLIELKSTTVTIPSPPEFAPSIVTTLPPSQSQPLIYIPPPPEPPKPPKIRRKPMVKEFGKAHSYAEKRLSEAIKERAEAMGKVAMLNAEIPSLVQIIKALGMTPNMNGFQDFTAHIPNTMPTYQQPQYQPPIEHSPAAPNNIDPALFQANSNPLPGLAPALANAPVVANKPLGGAIDLDFVPVDDEGPELPKMGGGWQ